jgi:hypothetical protein
MVGMKGARDDRRPLYVAYVVGGLVVLFALVALYVLVLLAVPLHVGKRLV